MRRYNWLKVVAVILVFATNLAAALFTAFAIWMLSLIANVDLIHSGDWTPTIGDKLNALFKTSIISTVIFLISVGLVTLCNWQICKAGASNNDSARSWTLYLSLLTAAGVLLGAVCSAIQILQET